jgi:hypothetical protein
VSHDGTLVAILTLMESSATPSKVTKCRWGNKIGKDLVSLVEREYTDEVLETWKALCKR